MHWKRKWVIVGIMCGFFLVAPNHNSDNSFGAAAALAAVDVTTQMLQSVAVSLHFGLDAMKLGNLREASAARAFKQPHLEGLAAAVARFLRATTAHQAHTVPCIDTEVLDRIEALSDITITLPECPARFDEERELSSDIKVSTRGSVNFSRTNDDFMLALNKFEIVTTHVADGSILKEDLDLTITGTIEHTTLCRAKAIPDSVSAEINGVFSKKIDENADGIWDEDTHGRFERFVLEVTVSEFEPESCMPTSFAVSESGLFTFGDEMNDRAAFTVDVWQSAPVVLNWETVADSIQVGVNGSVSLTSPCSTASLALNTADVLVFPILDADSESAACPTSGAITVTGDQTTTVTFTPSGGIEIDRNGDGRPDERFENCHEAQFCP